MITTSIADNKWRTWKGADQDDDPTRNNNNNDDDDDDYCKSSPIITTAADPHPLLHKSQTTSLQIEPPAPTDTPTYGSCECEVQNESPHLSTHVSITLQDHHDRQQQLQQHSLSPENPRTTIAPILPDDGEESRPPIVATSSASLVPHRHSEEGEMTIRKHKNPTIPVDSTNDTLSVPLQNHHEAPQLSMLVAVPVVDLENSDAEKERRRQALAFEQQQRILRQVEAARQAKRAKEKDKQHQPEGLRVLTHAASSNPPTEITDSTGMTKTLSTNAKIKHRVHNIHNNNMSSDDQQHQHHYFDDTTTRAARRAHQRERPPRTKGLLYQRQPNGTLVPMDRPHIGRH